MLIARAARQKDLPDILRLAKLAGPGFTSLSVGEDVLAQRLKKSIRSFTEPTAISPDHHYLLILENDGVAIGMSAIKAQVGLRDPFFSFRILNVAQKSKVTEKRFDMKLLVLVNDHTGATEIASLFVMKDKRGTGAGRLISQARYMLMASDPDRFDPNVISELRGHVDSQGISPFWEAIGRKFFDMDFDDADHISAEQDNQFILDLMPQHPIYVDLLPQEARDVIGQTHPAGVGARRLLKAEGFRYDGTVDIFDAGPTMSVPRDEIRTIKQSWVLNIERSSVQGNQIALISNNNIANFACIESPISISGATVSAPAVALKALEIKSGDKVRIWIKQ